MRRAALLAIVAALAIPPALADAKARVEHWAAMSTTAMSITGDIDLSPTMLRAAHVTYPLRVAADVPAFKADTGTFPARILAVTKPIKANLRHGNRFCEPSPRWIVVYHPDPGTLGMAVFSGSTKPTDIDSPGLCGTYSYSR
jgi:hypothetical protein